MSFFLAFVQQKYKIFQKIKEMKCEMRLPAAQFVMIASSNITLNFKKILIDVKKNLI